MKGLDSKNTIENFIIKNLGYYDEEMDRVCKSMNRSDLFYDFLQYYSHYNDQFAPGVINLASRIHYKLMPKYGNSIASHIASTIYSACDHEYHEHYGDKNYTHGQLSMAFRTVLKRVTESKEVEIAGFSKVFDLVKCGYLVPGYEELNKDSDEAFGLGFHLASESLAALEFYTLDKYTAKHWNDFYTEMTTKNLEGIDPDAWHWVKIHASVEEEHFMDGLDSFRSWSSLLTKDLNEDEYSKELEIFYDQIKKGFEFFQYVQDQFYKVLSQVTETKLETENVAATN